MHLIKLGFNFQRLKGTPEDWLIICEVVNTVPQKIPNGLLGLSVIFSIVIVSQEHGFASKIFLFISMVNMSVSHVN